MRYTVILAMFFLLFGCKNCTSDNDKVGHSEVGKKFTIEQDTMVSLFHELSTPVILKRVSGNSEFELATYPDLENRIFLSREMRDIVFHEFRNSKDLLKFRKKSICVGIGRITIDSSNVGLLYAMSGDLWDFFFWLSVYNIHSKKVTNRYKLFGFDYDEYQGYCIESRIDSNLHLTIYYEQDITRFSDIMPKVRGAKVLVCDTSVYDLKTSERVEFREGKKFFAIRKDGWQLDTLSKSD